MCFSQYLNILNEERAIFKKILRFQFALIMQGPIGHNALWRKLCSKLEIKELAKMTTSPPILMDMNCFR